MVEPVDCFGGWLKEEDNYAWGHLFNASWQVTTAGMSEKAVGFGLVQEDRKPYLIWKRDGRENCRWAFVKDPSEIKTVQALYNDPDNAETPACYIVVKQPDETDDRGDVIFDIFQMTPKSYLQHHNRVYRRRSSKRADIGPADQICALVVRYMAQQQAIQVLSHI